MIDPVTLSLDEARQLCLAPLRATGLSETQCQSVTRVILTAQADECQSHGLYRLLGCVHSLRCGWVNPMAEPVLTHLAPSVLRVDADRGFSTPALELAVEPLIEAARRTGMAALAINNCHHFSALWPEIEPPARRGYVALAMTPSHANVAPAGGHRGVFGTNPFAFAWPRPGRDPFVFDFATSATARGEIELHQRAGTPLPPGLAVDPEGRPTVDPATALRGAMLTFGGHKGSALAAMVDLLAGVLIGDLISLQSLAADAGRGATPRHGELILLLDPASFLGDGVEGKLARAELLFDAILDQGARLPSQRRYEARSRTAREGLVIPRSLYEDIVRLQPVGA